MRSRFVWKRWRSRVVLGIMVLTLLILAAVSLYTYSTYQAAAERIALESNRQFTYVSAARLRSELTRFSEVLDNLARTQQLYRGQLLEQQQALHEARHRLTIFDGGVVMLDNFGQVRSSEPARPEIQSADWSDRAFFRKLLETSREYYSETTNDGPDGSPVAVVSVPIMGEGGEFVGALVGMFRLGESRVSSLYASIVRLRIGQSGNTYVLDSNGGILYDSSFTRIGQKLELPPSAATDLQGIAFRTTDLDGNDVIASFAPIPGTGWTLVSEDEWAIATSATRSYANSLVILLALGTVLPALGVALLIRTQNAEMLERERDAQEQRVAWLIQERLLPGAAPMLPGWNVDVFYKPHPASGGDFYDFYLMSDGSLALMLGHANAKGLEAAHVIDTVRAALRSAARLRLPPGEALTHANALVCPELHGEACVSSFYATLHPPTGQLVFGVAGSLPPWYSESASDGDLLPEGISLGQDIGSEYRQRTLTIQPGECVLIFSAGLFKARRPDGALFDLASLRVIVTEPGRDAEGVVEALHTQLKSYTGMKGLPPDDVTVIIVQRHAEVRPAEPMYWATLSTSRTLNAVDFGMD